MKRVWFRYFCRRHHDSPSRFYSSRRANAGWRPAPFCTTNIRAFHRVNQNLKSDSYFLRSDIDPGFAKLEQSREAILERAKVHGIEDFDRLAFEADIGATKDLGKRLLDDDASRQDLDLWAVVLDYRQSTHGPDGVRAVLASMLYHGGPVTLQTDSVSKHIWQTILSVALHDRDTLFELCQVGSSLMVHQSFVFRDIVGHFLMQDDLRMAITFGTQLLSRYFRGRDDLLHLFDVVFELGSDSGIHNFCQLISRLPVYQIYGDTIHVLWSAGRKRHAFALHRHLLSLGHHPTDFSQIEALVREIAQMNVDIEPFLRHLESHGIFYSHQARRLFKQERARHSQDSSMLNKLNFSVVPETRPMKLSDAFIARTLATRSVSSDVALNGLRLIGLLELGPLALRELAVAAGSIGKLKYYFQQLDDMGIDIGASTFVRIVRSLCLSDQESLLNLILESDMHHEAFEDTEMQKRLLRSYLGDSAWSEVSRTLVILNKGRRDREAESRAHRLVLQTALASGDWRRVTMMLDDMRKANQNSPHRPVLAPLRQALRRVWSDIDVETRMSTQYLDRPLYLVGLMQFAETAGLTVYPWQWRSVLRATGRSQDWDLFQYQIVVIARMFQLRQQSLHDQHLEQLYGTTFTLETLFDKKMQTFIIETGLTADAEGEDPQKVWLRGPMLLRTLADRFDLNVGHGSVKSAFRNRLNKLFAGVEVGKLRSLVDRYMSCFNWAWAEANMLPDRESLRSLRQGGVAAADMEMLNNFRSRSRHVLKRRNPIISSAIIDEKHATLDYHDLNRIDGEDMDRRTPPATLTRSNEKLRQREEDHNDAPVFYEDLLHPSYGTR